MKSLHAIVIFLLALCSCSKDSVEYQRKHVHVWLNREFAIAAVYVNGQLQIPNINQQEIKQQRFSYKTGKNPPGYNWTSGYRYSISNDMKTFSIFRTSPVNFEIGNLPGSIQPVCQFTDYSANTGSGNVLFLMEQWDIITFNRDNFRLKINLNDNDYEVWFNPK